MNYHNPFLFTDPKLQQELEQVSRVKKVNREDVLIWPDDPIHFLPVVLEGSLRIVRQDENGKEVFLYHLYPGQTCAASLICCQRNRKSLIKAVAEDNAEVLQIPVSKLEDWFRYPEWRQFILQAYNQRFEDLLQVIDLIAFSQMDRQLWHYLHERARALETRVLQITHADIADELHTHREAISRLLRTMQEKGLVKLGRGTIELLKEPESL